MTVYDMIRHERRCAFDGRASFGPGTSKEMNMIGKILGAVAGSSISKHVNGVGGARGALLGVGAAAVLRRLGPIGLVTAIAGGYALKKYREKQEAPRFTQQPKV